jgi:hypothetical protein
MYWVDAAETYETIYAESGMRYQSLILGPIHARIGPLVVPNPPEEPHRSRYGTLIGVRPIRYRLGGARLSKASMRCMASACRWAARGCSGRCDANPR